VGVVGLNNQGAYNWGELAHKTDADVVAICDVDDRVTAAARKQFPKATFFTDFRKMIDAKGLDAVLCATPDHNHFTVTHRALPAPKPIPAGLDWELWLGPAAERPYAPEYVPYYWRRYWAFGGGRMADMACHHMDLPFWALDLRHPTKVSATGSTVTPETAADW